MNILVNFHQRYKTFNTRIQIICPALIPPIYCGSVQKLNAALKWEWAWPPHGDGASFSCIEKFEFIIAGSWARMLVSLSLICCFAQSSYIKNNTLYLKDFLSSGGTVEPNWPTRIQSGGRICVGQSKRCGWRDMEWIKCDCMIF